MVNTISMFESVGRCFCAFMKIQPINTPMPTPPATIQLKLSPASYQINCPVATVISANLKMIKEDASLSKLSPSKIEEKRLGTFTNFKIAFALTASGGDTIPPNKNPSANVKPGMKLLATIATDNAEKNTTINAKLPIIRLQRQSSFQEIDQA